MAENFARLLEGTVRRFPDKTALIWEGGSYSFAEIDLKARAAARWLSLQGAKAGDRVALAIPNSAPWVIVFLATLKLGATPAPLNSLLKKEELYRIIADMKPAVTLSEGSAPLTAAEPVTETAPGDHPGLILYTSGSTGAPKGAVFSQEALTFANRSWAGPVMALTPEDVVLAVLPFAHSLGLNGALLAPLLTGSTVVLLERFSAQAAMDTIERHRVTVFPGVATMFQRVLQSPAFARPRFSSLRIALSGAAPCPHELSQLWLERTGVKILRGYGMTELFRPVSYLAGDPSDSPDAVGCPVPGVEIRIVNEEARVLPPGDVGELWIKSPAAMTGYLDAPADTAAVMVDGWFKTGDLARITPEGFVCVVGRIADRILRGGYSVFPPEVEAVLLSHPEVAEAAVVGVPDVDLGEEVAAFVTLKSGARTTSEEIVYFCKERVAAYKYPRKVTILDRFPKGPTGKTLKARLLQG